MLYTIIIPALFLISACYASVGLGGGSAYLAVLSFWNADPNTIRPMAWGLNILCTGIVFWNYYRQGFFSFRIALPFLLGGLLGSIFGARIPISPSLFRFILALVLLFASIRMVFNHSPGASLQQRKEQPFTPAFILGLVIGILSGVVGIGGGIILGPIIISLGWLDVKHTAPITSLFILISSLGAFVSFFLKYGGIDWLELIILGITVNIGGFIGSRFGAGYASPKLLKRIFAVITFSASLKLLSGFIL